MLLEIKKLSVRVKSSGLKAVDGIDLSVDAGEPLLILGQSGSGKTMICRALFGLTNRYDFDVSGQIVFEGEDILSADAKKRRKLYGSDIALIPQNPMTAFDPSCKIGNQLAETYRLHNKSSAKAARNAVLEAMQRAGLEDCKAVWSSYPYMLSGGMLQRAAVAAAIMNRPRLIIADEPTPGMDLELAKKSMKDFRKFADEGNGVLLITHDIELALQVADRIVVFYAGKTVEEAPVSDFDSEETLRHPYTKALWRALPQNGFVPLAGVQPYVKDMPEGCPFGPRCGWYQEHCREEIPMVQAGCGSVRCVRYCTGEKNKFQEEAKS